MIATTPRQSSRRRIGKIAQIVFLLIVAELAVAGLYAGVDWLLS